MPTMFYTGTDPNPPAGASEVAMTADTLAPALFAWLFLTINPQWLPYLTKGHPLPSATIENIAGVLGITPGCLLFIFSLGSDGDISDAMAIVANRFQAINQANNTASSYPIPCPKVEDLMAALNYLKKP